MDWRRCPKCDAKTEITMTPDNSDVIEYCTKCGWELW